MTSGISLPPTQFYDQVPDHFVCIMCAKVPFDMLKCLTCEGIYCKACAWRYLQTNNISCPYSQLNTCPATLCSDLLIANMAITERDYLGHLKVYCQFASEGCQQLPVVNAYATHVNKKCQYNPRHKVYCNNCDVTYLPVQMGHRRHNCVKDVHTELKNSIQEVLNLCQNTNERVTALERCVSGLQSAVLNLEPRVTASEFQIEHVGKVRKMRPIINDMRRLYGMSDRVESAFLSIDRANYIPLHHYKYAYTNTSVHDQSCVAWSVVIINLLDPFITEGSKILVMSAFPGYEAAVLSHLVGNTGCVVAQDPDKNQADRVFDVYRFEVPTYVESERLGITIEEDAKYPSKICSSYNAIIDRKRWTKERSGNTYLQMLAPMGIAVYFSVNQDCWLALRKLASGGVEYFYISIPSDRSDPHILLEPEKEPEKEPEREPEMEH